MSPSVSSPAIFHRSSPSMTVIERGWLNCNQIVLTAPDRNVLIDSGYGRHATSTIGFVEEALGAASLNLLVNTHCHSDHMGGNRACAAHFGCEVVIPEGEVRHVVPWTEQSCWSQQMDQYAEEFAIDATLAANDTFHAGGFEWQAVAAPGHDMDAFMYFAPETGTLVSGDALWEKGMGFVWPEAGQGRNSFIDAARATLDAIEDLPVRLVIPGHGSPFADVAGALTESRSRLNAFAADPARHARHVVRALFVFSLLDRGSMRSQDVPAYIAGVPVYGQMRGQFLGGDNTSLAHALIADLKRAGAIAENDGVLTPAMRA
jgi:glyoxylase-like metal-dependent hydrolase (beta-lactamase superfamily II)